jgi:hypothetical protein
VRAWVRVVAVSERRVSWGRGVPARVEMRVGKPGRG